MLEIYGRNIYTKGGVVQFENNLEHAHHRLFINTSTVNGQLEAFRRSYTAQSAMSKRVSAIVNLRIWAKDVNYKKVTNKYVQDDLKKLNNPNKLQHFNSFNALIDTQAVSHGCAYVYKKKIIGFNEFENYVVPNDIIFPMFDSRRNYNPMFEIEPDYYNIYLPDGQILRLETDEIVRFSDNWIKNRRGTYGVSRLEALQEPITILLNAGETMSTLLSEGGMRGILSLGGSDREMMSSPFLIKERNELQEEMKKYGGLRGQFHYFVTKSNASYTPITSKIVDMQLPENLKLAESAVYGGFGVPNAYLEMETRYKAMPEARKEFITGTICPEISTRYEQYQQLMGIPERDWEYYPDFSHMDFYQIDLQQSATAMLNASTAAKNLNEAGVNQDKILGFLEQFFE